MGHLIKFIVGFVFLILLTMHLAMLFFFLAPTPKLLGIVLGSQASITSAADIPEEVQQFLIVNKLKLEPRFDEAASLRAQLAMGILEFRHERLRENDERMALELNLLPFGEEVIGLEAAAEYYYKKPVNELSSAQWVNLVNLHKIYSKQLK